jgi:hypothetical protein
MGRVSWKRAAWVSGFVCLGVIPRAAASPTGVGARNAAEAAAEGDAPSALEIATPPAASEPAPSPVAPDAPAPALPPAPSPAASDSPPAPLSPEPPWVRKAEVRKETLDAITEARPAVPELGEGFHVFDPTYFSVGINTQSLCHAAAWELEGSVATISDSMFWAGAYGTAGIQVGRKPAQHQRPSDESACFERQTISYRKTSRGLLDDKGDGYRYGGGVEFGWRMLGVDLGYLKNTALANQDHGIRLRVGLALAEELFTGGMTRYGKQCCSIGLASSVPCECPRTPVGVSLFFYYAREEYFDRRAHLGLDTRQWGQNSVGISLKLAVGVGGAG